jgi:putative membrane protein insertion efficiency factor
VNLRDRMIVAAHGAYKLVLSPLLHAVDGCTGACRFQPTCSEYAAIAVSEYGLLSGGGMTLWRLLRCQPFCKGGFDPVKPNPLRQVASENDGLCARGMVEAIAKENLSATEAALVCNRVRTG